MAAARERVALTARYHSRMLRSLRYPLLVSLACVGLPALAKHMYQYTDSNGVVHFTDMKPEDSVGDVKTTLVRTDRQPLLRLDETGPDADRTVGFVNASGGPVSVQLSFDQAVNVASDPPLPAMVVAAPLGETRALEIHPVDNRAGYRYRYVFKYMPGDYRAVQDANATYRVPFDTGTKTFRVDQSFHGRFSHHDPQNEYAVDIDMPEGTSVLAARDGVVMTLDNDFFGNGLDMAQYGDRANNIRIVHADGAMSVYAHLKLESARVHVGQHVKAGHVIAQSGDTGYASGPHLHFCVQMNKDMQLVSVPFQFDDESGTFTPQQGQMLGGR
jgi:murein DD-endopeptidase MepM/ murein hydrolase activator NlpD